MSNNQEERERVLRVRALMERRDAFRQSEEYRKLTFFSAVQRLKHARAGSSPLLDRRTFRNRKPIGSGQVYRLGQMLGRYTRSHDCQRWVLSQLLGCPVVAIRALKQSNWMDIRDEAWPAWKRGNWKDCPEWARTVRSLVGTYEKSQRLVVSTDPETAARWTREDEEAELRIAAQKRSAGKGA